MIGILRYWLVLALGISLAAFVIPGIDYGDNWGALALVVIVMSLLNLVLKPVLILLTLPFVILTLGVGIWIINALMLYFASNIVDDFVVESFWSALFGAAIISLTHFAANRLFDGKKERPKRFRGRKDNVIDV